jgi:hypothetical protein
MVHYLEESRGNLLAIRVSGVIDRQHFEAFNPVLEQVLNTHKDPRYYLELPAFDKVTPKAILEDIKNLPKYNRFVKVAVVGDAKWMESLITLLGGILKPETKYFDIENKKTAMEWVRGNEEG